MKIALWLMVVLSISLLFGCDKASEPKPPEALAESSPLAPLSVSSNQSKSSEKVKTEATLKVSPKDLGVIDNKTKSVDTSKPLVEAPLKQSENSLPQNPTQKIARKTSSPRKQKTIRYKQYRNEEPRYPVQQKTYWREQPWQEEHYYPHPSEYDREIMRQDMAAQLHHERMEQEAHMHWLHHQHHAELDAQERRYRRRVETQRQNQILEQTRAEAANARARATEAQLAAQNAQLAAQQAQVREQANHARETAAVQARAAEEQARLQAARGADAQAQLNAERHRLEQERRQMEQARRHAQEAQIRSDRELAERLQAEENERARRVQQAAMAPAPAINPVQALPPDPAPAMDPRQAQINADRLLAEQLQAEEYQR